MDVDNPIALREISLVQRGISLPALENKWLISLASFSYFSLCLPVFLRSFNLVENPGAGGEKEGNCGNCRHDSKSYLSSGK